MRYTGNRIGGSNPSPLRHPAKQGHWGRGTYQTPIMLAALQFAVKNAVRSRSQIDGSGGMRVGMCADRQGPTAEAGGVSAKPTGGGGLNRWGRSRQSVFEKLRPRHDASVTQLTSGGELSPGSIKADAPPRYYLA